MKKVLLILVMLISLFSMNMCLQSSTFAADWSQRFQQSSTEIYEGHQVGVFDEIKIWWKSGDKFSDPSIKGAFSNFSAPGWSIYNISDTYAYVLGPANSTYTQFDINFAGLTPNKETEFWAAVLSNGDVKQRQILDFNGQSWTYPGISEASWKAQGGPTITPEPISSLLFLLGGGALVGIKRFRKHV